MSEFPNKMQIVGGGEVQCGAPKTGGIMPCKLVKKGGAKKAPKKRAAKKSAAKKSAAKKSAAKKPAAKKRAAKKS